MSSYQVKLIIWKDKETYETSELNRCIRGGGISTYTPCGDYSGAAIMVLAQIKAEAKSKASGMFWTGAGHVEILSADFVY